MGALLMAVTATLPLLVEIGNQRPDTIFTGNDSWVEYETNGYWGAYVFANGVFSRSTIVEVDDRGFLHAEPDPTRTDDGFFVWWTASNSRPWSIIDSEIYWQWKPMDGPNSTAYFFMVGGNGLFDVTIEILNGEAFIDAGNNDVLFPYDFDEHRWWRVVDIGGYIHIQTAPSGGTWYTQLIYGPTPVQEPFELRNEVYIDFALYMDSSDPASGDGPGWIGPINQQPVPRELPLLVDIGDPLVTRVTKTLPLLVDIGDPSP